MVGPCFMSPLNKKSGISFFQLLELLHTEVGKDETHLCQYGIIIISLCGFWSSAQVGKSEKSLAVKPDTYSCVIVELWQRRYGTAGQGNRKVHRLDEKTQLQKRLRSFFGNFSHFSYEIAGLLYVENAAVVEIL